MRKNSGLGPLFNAGYRRSGDPFSGGSRRPMSFGDHLSASMFGSMTGGNKPGGEFMRRGYRTNMAGIYTRELTNSLFRSPNSKPFGGGRKRRS
jgi:hypothetical protein